MGSIIYQYHAQYHTPSVPKYKSFQRLHYKLHTDVYRHILECRFTHFTPYVVHSELSKKTYIQERREYISTMYQDKDFGTEGVSYSALFIIMHDTYQHIIYYDTVSRYDTQFSLSSFNFMPPHQNCQVGFSGGGRGWPGWAMAHPGIWKQLIYHRRKATK